MRPWGAERWARRCLSKSRYPTAEKAQRYLEKSNAREPNPALRVYYCRDCDGYHLTSQPKLQRGERFP